MRKQNMGKQNMGKRLLGILLTFAMILSMFPTLAFADQPGETAVHTQEQLAAMEAGGSYLLADNIELTDWTSLDFAGTLNGNGYTITLNGTPLFDSLSGTVKNLLLNGSVKAEQVGTLAVTNNGGTIYNCYSGAAAEQTAYNNIGGLVYEQTSGTIANCVVTGELSKNRFPTLYGIATKADGGTISNCYWSSEGVKRAVRVPEGNSSILINCAYKSAEEMREASFLNQLNANTGEDGLEWGLDQENGTPIPGGAYAGTAVEKEALANKIAEIEAIANQGPDGPYTTETWQALQEVLTAAQALLADETASQSQVDAKIAALEQAKNALEKDLSGEVDRTALQTAIVGADEAVASGNLYTAASWAPVETALKNARKVDSDARSTQVKINEAAGALNSALEGLTARTLAMQPAPAEVHSITTIDEFLAMAQAQPGEYYRLDADLKLKVTSGDTYITQEWRGFHLNCTFDGNGHTLTLPGAEKYNPMPGQPSETDVSVYPVFSSIGEAGVVQNLGVGGTVNLGGSVIAESCAGLIANCWSQASARTGGLVNELASGGKIYNSYAYDASMAISGGLVGESSENSLIEHSYWLNGLEAAANGTPKLIASAAKTEKEFRAGEEEGITALLNNHRGELGLEWNRGENGFPYFGEENYQPPATFELTYTNKDGAVSAFATVDGLSFSMLEVDAEGHPGMLSYPEYASTETLIWGVADYNSNVLISSSGELFVKGTGSNTVILRETVGGSEFDTKELVRFPVTVTNAKIKTLGLFVNGVNVTDNTFTVEGSEWVTVTPKVQVEDGGAWKDVTPDMVQFEAVGKASMYNNTLCATEPGTIAIKAVGFDKTVETIMDSQYVAVTSIKPKDEGNFKLHSRNANSSGLGDFLDLKLSRGDHSGNNVVVEPANASYKDSWTLVSSDNTVAEYVSSMIVAVLPKKPGTVTLTATCNDPKLSAPITGTSTVTLEYFNPVTALTTEQPNLTVKVGEKIDLPLVFTGPESSNNYHVSEAGMKWEFEGDGQVEIDRDTLGVLLRTEKEYCIANDKYHVTGSKVGTVTATGTPVDQTNNAAPIVFHITVMEGAEEPEVDIDALVTKGIAGAQGYLAELHKESGYQYADEWDIFALSRSGQSIDPERVEGYLNSVAAKYADYSSLSPASNDTKPTTLARVILALGVLEQDAADFRGINLVDKLVNSSRMEEGGNEPMWTLLALDSLNYPVPEGASWTRTKLVDELIDRYQNPETGGFGLADNQTSGVDLTAMALQALAPYQKENAKAAAAVAAGLGYLKNSQNSQADFDNNVEAAAQVLTTLSTLGVDPLDSENGFVKGASRTLITNIFTFYDEASGGFKHSLDTMVMPMSTAQSLYSLEAYKRFQNGEKPVYDLTDVNIKNMLSAHIAEAETRKEADYTTGTWAAFKTALAEAKSILEKTGATKEELRNADNALTAAIARLEKKNPGKPDNPTDKNITVSFRMVGDLKHDSADSHKKYINWIKTYDVEIPKNGTVYDAFEVALAENGMDFTEGQHSYISEVQAPAVLGGYWLGEFDNGAGSGWKYLVNNKYPDVGLRYYQLKDGDKVVWRYVDDYKSDYDNTDKWKEAADVKPSASMLPGGSAGGVGGGDSSGSAKPAVTLKPNVTVNSKGEAETSVQDSEVKSALEQVKKEKAGTLVIAPQEKTGVSSLQVTLPASAVQAITASTGVALQLDTSLGGVELSNAALSAMNQQAKDNNLRITVKQKTPADVKSKVEDEATLKDAAIVEIKVLAGSNSITAFGGHNLIVSIPAGAKYETGHSYEVLVISDDGAVENSIGKCTMVGEKPVIQVSASHLSTFVATTAEVVPLLDIEKHWGRQAIEFVYGQGLMKGTGENLFQPDAAVSRDMLVTILYRMEKEPSVTAENKFTDVPAGQWYTNAITWAAANKIVSGVEERRFEPAAAITREQLATVLYNYAVYKKYNMSKTANLSAFTDAGSISAWAQNAVTWGVGQNLFAGRTNTTLEPQGSATRAELATILMRFIDTVQG